MQIAYFTKIGHLARARERITFISGAALKEPNLESKKKYMREPYVDHDIFARAGFL